MSQIIDNATQSPASRRFLRGYTPVIRRLLALLTLIFSCSCARPPAPEFEPAKPYFPSAAATPLPPLPLALEPSYEILQQERTQAIEQFLAALQPEPLPIPSPDTRATLCNKVTVTVDVLEDILFAPNARAPSLDVPREIATVSVKSARNDSPLILGAYQRHWPEPTTRHIIFEFIVSVYAIHD